MTHSDESERLLGDGLSIERRLAHIERMLEQLTGPAQQLPAFTASAIDTIDRLAAELDARGVDVDERLRNAVVLLERLTAPATVRAVDRLLELSETAPDLLATAVDTLDRMIAGAAERGVDVDARLQGALRLLERLTEPEVLEAAESLLARADQLQALARSEMLEAETVESLGMIGRAIRDTMHAETRSVGLFGSLAALRDRRVKPAVGFAFGVAERFGDALMRRDGQDPAHQLQEHNEPSGDK